ncbi:uncharacterized protein F5891DRAFT_981453 [Suillus fuscotomentosus]|uniref:Uncharacterized protein n=1 Tax=Suillus fuscotomentosus TaxID=1912939 RepID=A0AAD4E3S4_9AGAM|nr:uncharacterized protein F5891DRAFT_981453 [Suillus fuscotomentosus]KAG1899062.1 hypothetical protein F5891DRAFT_981453 [Suillus fuscotomentosus]
MPVRKARVRIAAAECGDIPLNERKQIYGNPVLKMENKKALQYISGMKSSDLIDSAMLNGSTKQLDASSCFPPPEGSQRPRKEYLQLVSTTNVVSRGIGIPRSRQSRLFAAQNARKGDYKFQIATKLRGPPFSSALQHGKPQVQKPLKKRIIWSFRIKFRTNEAETINNSVVERATRNGELSTANEHSHSHPVKVAEAGRIIRIMRLKF